MRKGNWNWLAAVLGLTAAAVIGSAIAPRRAETTQPDRAAGALSAQASAVSDAAAQRLRGEIARLDALLPRLVDRGPALFLLAHHYARLGEKAKALALLKECVALDEGFDPGESRAFASLQENAEFRELAAAAHHRNPPVHHAKVAFTIPQNDLFPEGLAVDASDGQFYMGSMHRKKIVKFRLGGGLSDFVREGEYDLSPVGGVHVDPADHSVWAATDAGEKQRPELLHFDAQGKLLERYASPGKMPYDLNDLVLRGSREIFATDTEGNRVYRFERGSHAFAEMRFWRLVFEPNGIALSGDGELLFVADDLGVIRVDLRTGESADIDPGPHDTLCGIDGLYWHGGELLGVEYGTGTYRVMRWRLSPEGLRVVSSEVLERGTEMVSDPTTGAIYRGNFYFMANTGIYNLEDDRILDAKKLEPVKIAVIAVNWAQGHDISCPYRGGGYGRKGCLTNDAPAG